MGVTAQELAHLVVERGGLGHEVGRQHHRAHVERGQPAWRGVGPAHQPVDGAQQVLGVHQADDVLGLAVEDGQAGVPGLQALGQDRLRIARGVDHLDLAPVEHHLLDRAVREVERAEDAVAVLLLDHALGMAEMERAGDLLAHREHVGVGVGLHPEEVEDPAHQPAHRADHGGEHPHHHGDRRRDQRRRALGVGDRVGLGQHLGEDQHQQRHHQRRQRHPRFAENAREQRRRQAGRENVDQVVAQQHAADQALVVLGDA